MTLFISVKDFEELLSNAVERKCIVPSNDNGVSCHSAVVEYKGNLYRFIYWHTICVGIHANETHLQGNKVNRLEKTIVVYE